MEESIEKEKIEAITEEDKWGPIIIEDATVINDYEKLVGSDKCPVCKHGLVSRQNRNDYSWFKGCSTFPSCCFTIDYLEYKKIQEKVKSKSTIKK